MPVGQFGQAGGHCRNGNRLGGRHRFERAGEGVEAFDAAQPAAGAPDERARLVKAVYRETDLPDKPRNMIGLKADILPEEMEALLRSNVKASPEAMRALALQRGLAVRDALIAKGLPSERLFLAAPRLRLSGEGDAAWVPSVNLTLSANR